MPEIITHVHVRFVDDKVMATVPRTSVKRFSPKHSEDFDKEKLYLVLWEVEAEHGTSPVAAYYKANILLLGTSEENIKTKLKASRLKFPAKRPIADTQDTADPGSEAEDTMKKKNLKKLRSAAKKDASMKILTEKMSTLKSQRLKIESSSEDEGKSDDNDSESIKESSPAKNETKCDERYKKSLSELYSELAVRVANLEAKVNKASNVFEPQNEAGTNNNKVTRKLFSEQENTYDQEDLPSMTETFISNEEGSDRRISNLPRYAIFATTKDDIKVKHVHLGSGISIDKDIWAMIEVRSEDSKFIKELATAVWTRSTLVTRSLDGKAAGRLPGQGTRKALSPAKMSVVRNRLTKKNYKGEQLFKELKRMNSFLTELINDFIKREVKAIRAQAEDGGKVKAKVDNKVDAEVDTKA